LVWFPLVNLYKQRSLITHLAITNIKIRFKGTYLGFLWTGIEPLLTFLLLYVVFTTIRLRTGENFAIYLLSGIVLYHIFIRGTMGGLGSLKNNTGILKSLHMKKEIFPVASTATMAILSIVEVGVLVSLFPFFGFIPSWTALLIPIPVILMLVLILGISYVLSIVTIYIKDIQTIWGIIIHALFFVSPIFWYIRDVDGFLLDIQLINPIGQLIELNHKIIVFGEIPPLSDWLFTTGFVFSILIVGYAVFRKFENKILEEL